LLEVLVFLIKKTIMPQLDVTMLFEQTFITLNMFLVSSFSLAVSALPIFLIAAAINFFFLKRKKWDRAGNSCF
jgi:hypothetical protein